MSVVRMRAAQWQCRNLSARLTASHNAISSPLCTRSIHHNSSAAVALPANTSSLGLAFIRSPPHHHLVRHASSASSSRWKTRQSSDPYSKAAKTSALKSRAAYKLLELDQRHKLFKPGITVVDLGYAPGSWSQVAVSRTKPGGRVVGIDVIPAQPPRGASTIQGNFLSESVQREVRDYVKDYWKGRARARGQMGKSVVGMQAESREGTEGVGAEELDDDRGVVEMDRDASSAATTGHQDQGDRIAEDDEEEESGGPLRIRRLTRAKQDEQEGRVVDLVLSDMSAPWELATSTWVKSVSNPYLRMMNTSGISFRDHAGSMDLCNAALTFCYDALRTGGHFLCKFYQGSEDKAFELRLKRLFDKVYREKPESSRSESKEAYFVAIRRKPDVQRAVVFPDEDSNSTEP